MKPLSKTCSRCKTEKMLDQFYVQGLRHRGTCKPCYAEHNREMRAKHADKRTAYDKQRGTGWSRGYRDKWEPSERQKWDRYLRRTYRITADQAEAMFDQQGRVCAICRQECNRSNTSRLCVDHDHATGKVRGLLCFQCNVGLGKFRDDWQVIRRAMEYLMEAS